MPWNTTYSELSIIACSGPPPSFAELSARLRMFAARDGTGILSGPALPCPASLLPRISPALPLSCRTRPAFIRRSCEAAALALLSPDVHLLWRPRTETVDTNTGGTPSKRELLRLPGFFAATPSVQRLWTGWSIIRMVFNNTHREPNAQAASPAVAARLGPPARQRWRCPQPSTDCWLEATCWRRCR